MLASLWWAKVFAWGRSTWAGTTSLLNAQGAAFDNLALKTFLGGISLLGSDHFDETKTTRLLGMWVKHDLALLNITIFLEETSDLCLGETRMNTGNEEVGAWVDCAIVLRSTVALRRTTVWVLKGLIICKFGRY